MLKNFLINTIKLISKIIIGIVIIFLLILVVIPTLRNYFNQKKVFKIVNENQTMLNYSIEKQDYKQALEIDGIKDVRKYETDDKNIYIEYYCSGFGLVSSSVYKGFYYHSIDEPIGYEGIKLSMEKSKKGWSWKESNGDNWYYTEKILDNWYYYEAGF